MRVGDIHAVIEAAPSVILYVVDQAQGAVLGKQIAPGNVRAMSGQRTYRGAADGSKSAADDRDLPVQRLGPLMSGWESYVQV